MADGQRSFRVTAGSVQVTDTTPTVVATMTIPPGHTATVQIVVVGQDQSAAAGKASVFTVLSVRSQGGSLSFDVLEDDIDNDPAYWRFQVDPGMVEVIASGNDLSVQFTGPGGTVVVGAWINAWLVEAAV